MAEVVCKSVMKPGVARHLLQLGYPIVDIKPKKENLEATIFLFEATDAFMKDFEKIMAKKEKSTE